jgi:hypothetical protein
MAAGAKRSGERFPGFNGVEELERRALLSAAPQTLAAELPPVLVSISRTAPASIQATNVAFAVTFSEPVTGVTAGDFLLSADPGISSDAPTVSPAAGPASVYTVSVNNLTGSGKLELSAENQSGIVNDNGQPLRGFVHFTPQPLAGPAAQDIAVADVNGDGKPDLIDADLTYNNIAVLLGNGDGAFQTPRTFSTGANSRPYSVAVGELNGDNNPDIVAADRGADSISVLLGNGNGTFQAQQTYSTGAGSAPYAVTLADVNGDGKIDAVVADSNSNSVSVFLGNGNGTFAPQQSFAVGNHPVSVAVADVNGDGGLDLIVANDNDKTVGVLLNATQPAMGGPPAVAFAPQQTFAAGGNDNRVLVADLNGDGLPDIVTSNPSNENVAVLRGSGGGTFAAPQTFAASGFNGISIADINGDGHPDLVANYFTGVALLPGNGDGTFQDEQIFDISDSKVSLVATADVNGDGHPDLVIAAGDNYTPGVVLTDLNGTEFAGPAYTILKRDALLNVTGAEAFFDGSPHAAAITATGTSGQDLSALASLSYTNLAGNTSSATPPVQPGTYELFASFSGNGGYNAIPSFDTGKTLVIERLSPLQSVPSGRLPSAALVAGQKIAPIRLNLRLMNAAAATATGRVTVNVTLSVTAGGTPTDPVVATLARTVNVRAHKAAPFGVTFIRSLPAGLTGTLHVLVKVTDASGAGNLVSAGTIVVAAPFTDLAAVSVVAPPRARLGKKLTSILTIAEHGNVLFSGSVPVELFLSITVPSPGPGAIDLGPGGGHLLVSPNRKGVLRLTATIPGTVSPGSYFVIAKLDPTDTPGDTNAGNNRVASLKKVVIG